MAKKGFYIKKGKRDQSIYLHIHKVDFNEYMKAANSDEWLKFRIYERDQPDTRGFTHNMELIQNFIFTEENNKKTEHE